MRYASISSDLTGCGHTYTLSILFLRYGDSELVAVRWDRTAFQSSF
ncbi:hypothetical protein P186_0948 [Pyrobaculum ferrireducens]|uniref:Uncharacterized protein n=1 Tax=Pyrobaculum ferrireducens TaxID=1104324 RepID=G7VBF9_9CREN|nr:hypothetical protein P186_0948 [Pyrobaculum ferrireducens]